MFIFGGVVDGDKRARTNTGIMEPRQLHGEEAEEFIVRLLRDSGRPLTTREVQAETEKRLVRCPDSTVVFLNKLRGRGLVRGEFSAERRAWIWWVET